MSGEMILRIIREGLLLIILISAAPMLASMVVGLVLSLFQATTQLQEQTLTYVPKLIAVFVTLAVVGPWMLAQSVRFAHVVFDSIALVK